MDKNTNFDQFSGPGKAYAPKTPRATKAAVRFAEPKQVKAYSEEDDMRATLRAERRMVPSVPSRSQSTDHMQ
jgi:hypothetical protein